MRKPVAFGGAHGAIGVGKWSHTRTGNKRGFLQSQSSKIVYAENPTISWFEYRSVPSSHARVGDPAPGPHRMEIGYGRHNRGSRRGCCIVHALSLAGGSEGVARPPAREITISSSQDEMGGSQVRDEKRFRCHEIRRACTKKR